MEKPEKSIDKRARTTDQGSATGPQALSEPYLRTKDFLVSGEEFELIQANPAGLLRTCPTPSNLSEYYQSEDYISHTDHRRTLFEKLYQGVKKLNLKRKVKLLKRFSASPGTILDFGAGTGDFLLAAQNAGWTSMGVEPEAGARSRGQAKGAQVWDSLDGVPPQKFEVITLWHVLEHLPEPEDTIKALRDRLASNGHLIVAVPNYRSYDAKWYGPFWAAYDTPRHLWHFTRPAMKRLIKDLGFECVKEKPLWFDAYYVSWLSEKYRNKRFAPARAFLLASLSNMLAVFNGESSSRIYIFRKVGS